MNVNNKVVLVTGGAGAIGSKICEVLAANGAIIYALDIAATREKGLKLVEKIAATGGKAAFMPIDITKEAEWQQVVTTIIEKEGRIDVLVNNAGINILKPIEEMNIYEWMRMMEVNTGGCFLGCKYTIPHMRKQGGGAIINTSSQCGLIGHKYTPECYTATKGAITTFTKAIASRYGKDNIRCNEICPSTVVSGLTIERLKNPQFAAERIGEVPLGRLCTVEDCAYAILYLASEEAKYINGVALPVDGGSTCD